MVFFPPLSNIPRFNAYLLSDITDDALAALKRSFELGTCAPFNTRMELVLRLAPTDYLGKPHAYIRIKENEAGRPDPFVLIDERAIREGAVWYVDRFADQEEVDDEIAVSTAVLWEILVKTECLPITWVNYDIANMSIQEDLDSCGVESPVPENFEQPEVWASGGLDMEREYRSQVAWITAEPGEFEESTDEALRANFMPKPDRVARLREGLAEEVGLVNGWTIPSNSRLRVMSGGIIKEFPEGSVILQLRYNPDVPWPAYKWPEESL
ncbi:hypothetical protein F4821DRAFT_234185 [Hypoxylon rubiginosum]|uniref:Uncharacterized protein n=1 Tax=Hypoxylon rubiginosum TaxID=110542 RepID=A0ACC0D6E8_9PEZI|nr:hypothetical protein F4821DRAFT_234185 [Hypoxylon rubiginosum]